MSCDYWVSMFTDERCRINSRIAECEEGPSRREEWMKQHLRPLLTEGASGLAYYRAFERAAMSFLYYTAIADRAREDVRAAYSAILTPRFAIPGPVLDLGRTLVADPPDLTSSWLPELSLVWQFRFRLAADYLSQDDVGLYPIDNPVRKEWILRLPMVASTAWKGALRSAFRLRHNVGDHDPAIIRLFGETRGEEEGQAGRLCFYPTYFEGMGLTVINPHNRRTGVGERGPILFETVPHDSRAWFSLLYVPRGQAEASDVADDILGATRALQAMFTTYGFGAKTSSGFGVVDGDGVRGQLALRIEGFVSGLEEAKPPEPRREKELPRYLRAKDQLRDEFVTPEGELVSKEEYQAYVESLGKEYTRTDQQLYEKARKWWKRRQKGVAERPVEEPDQEPGAAEPRWVELPFLGLGGMIEQAESLAEIVLKARGGKDD